MSYACVSNACHVHVCSQCLYVPEAVLGHEVEEMEEFLQVVLQGRARQQQLVLDLVVAHDAEELTTTHAMSGFTEYIPS